MPRPINEQVVVITGASSGIGRETALQLAQRGASVALAARGADALETLTQEVERIGGRALAVPTDVAEWEQVRALADQAVERFERIDTWVNAAAVSAYGLVEHLTVEEIDRVMRINLMGQVHGVKAALPHLRRQGRGTIVSVSSVLGKRGLPLQAPYCASKHGIVGFMDALRLELEHAGGDIAVTTILPSSINTPLFDNATSRMGVRPAPIPPVYEPRTVAEAIVLAAEHPRREIVVGGAGKMLELTQRLSPALADRLLLLRDQAFKKQRRETPDKGQDSLFRPGPATGSATGSFGERSKATSAYTRALEQHPSRKRAAALAALAGAASAARKLAR